MLRAKDIMTSPIISVGPDARVADVAELLLTHGISAVPVIEKGTLRGIVSEGDFLHREEIDTLPPNRSWWLGLFRDNGALARGYAKTHSVHVADVMTRDVVTVDEETPVREIADILERRHIKRVPVLRDGRLTGIVSRANLIRALAVAFQGTLLPVSREESDIRTDVLTALRKESWTVTTGLDASVADGVVTLWGTFQSEDERRASQVLVENIPGVSAVDDRRVLIDLAYKVAYGAI